jgi:molybdopterin-synthase adenylyltransferase
MNDSRNSPVLLVGVGGLGVPVAMALARGGIPALTLIDPDPVDLSNLHRQVLFGESDLGAPKVIVAARRLREIAPATRLEAQVGVLDGANAENLVSRSAFVIDATDNPATKFLINDACIAAGTPFVYGGVLGMTGQALTIIPRRTACLRCLFEEPPGEDEIASCQAAGIIGPVAGVIGEAQAAEAMRWLRAEMPALAGKMLIYHAKPGRLRLVEIAARSGCRCGAAANVSAAAVSSVR